MSREIEFKVSLAIKKIAEDITPTNNYMQVPLKMPVDTPLKIRTWKDSWERDVDPIIQQLNKQNNNMNYARKVVDDVEEQNSEHINACDKVYEDLKALWKNYKELVKEVGELFDRKVHTKIKDFMDDTEKNLKLTMNSQVETSGTLKNLKIWMKAQSTSLTKNFNELKTYLHHQEKYQSNATYVPPPPKQRDPPQEYIKTHEDWNKTGAFVIKNSLTHQR